MQKTYIKLQLVLFVCEYGGGGFGEFLGWGWGLNAPAHPSATILWPCLTCSTSHYFFLFFFLLLPLCCFFFSAFSPWLFSFFFFLLSHLFLFSFLFLSFCFSFFLFFFSLSSSSLKSSEIPPDLPSSGATRYYRMYRSGRQYRNPFNLVHGFPTALACEAKRRR